MNPLRAAAAVALLLASIRPTAAADDFAKQAGQARETIHRSFSNARFNAWIDKHKPITHMYITRKAYEMYVSRYPGGELERYIGRYRGDTPEPADDTVVAGSFNEDRAFRNPWNEALPFPRHFWDYRDGLHKGLAGHDSSINRAYKYFTGGYGIDDLYDTDWSENSGSRRGTRGQGILALYRQGRKAKAYGYLGHVTHLLEDLAVPAHVLLWTHLPGVDAYETYMKSQHKRWADIPSGPIETFPSLLELFRQTAQVTVRFDTGRGGGPLLGKDGTVDRGRRRRGGFSEKELKEQGDVLIPLAVKRVAALFLYFYKQVDQTPPRVTLQDPRAGLSARTRALEPPRVVLSASAADEQSGVDRLGFRFEYRFFEDASAAAWTSVTPGPAGPTVEFGAVPGVAYAYRVTALDAAGNAAVSEEKSFALPAAEAAALHARLK